MKDSERKRFTSFKQDIARSKTEKVVIREGAWVVIDYEFWKANQSRYDYYRNLEKSIYGKVN